MDKSYCLKCGECCRKIPVDFNKKVMYRDGIQPLKPEFAEMLTPVVHSGDISYCICKYLDGNLCTNPDKPQECIDYPSSPFANLPDKCVQSGNIFIEAEKIKHRVRKLKEEILDYNILINTVNNKFERAGLIKIIQKHKKFIDKYSLYGSDDW